MATTTYLITGGMGFIGSHLAERLLNGGDQVLILDNMSTGRAENLAHLVDHPRLTVHNGSVLDELIVDELVHQCDVIVHLAAAVGVKLIVDRPLHSLITNLHGFHTVIEAAHRYRKKILVASTSEIYGKNDSGALAETSDRVLGSPTVVRWAYSTAKAVDEIEAGAYHRERGLPTIIVRLFNTVGPRQSPAYGMVIPRLVRQALSGEPLTVHGDGTQTRCFAHVHDVVTAICGLLGDDRAIGGTFNIGSTEEVSILELAKRIIEHTESTSGIDMIPYWEAYDGEFEDMPRRLPDTTKIQNLIGWRTTRSLDHILSDVIDDARAQAR